MAQLKSLQIVDVPEKNKQSVSICGCVIAQTEQIRTLAAEPRTTLCDHLGTMHTAAGSVKRKGGREPTSHFQLSD